MIKRRASIYLVWIIRVGVLLCFPGFMAYSVAEESDEVRLIIGNPVMIDAQTAHVPVMIKSQEVLPSTVDFTLSHALPAEFIEALPGPAVTQSGKQVYAGTPLPGVVIVVITGGLTEIPDGILVILKYDISRLSNSIYSLDVIAIEAAAAASDASPLPVNMFGLSPNEEPVSLPFTPSRVRASHGLYTNKIVVEWDNVPNASFYNVYRTSESRSFADSQHVAIVYDTTIFEDEQIVPGNTSEYTNETGCAAGATDDDIQYTRAQYYYWVTSVNTAGESAPSSPALGYIMYITRKASLGDMGCIVLSIVLLVCAGAWRHLFHSNTPR